MLMEKSSTDTEFSSAVLDAALEYLDMGFSVIPVRNDFFGGNTGVTGLMTAEDVARVLDREPEGHRYLLPDVCLSDEGRFLDGPMVRDLPRPVEVVATDGIALRAALEQR